MTPSARALADLDEWASAWFELRSEPDADTE